MIQDDELGAGLDVACVVLCQTLVETLVGLDQAQNLQVVLLLANTRRVLSPTRQPADPLGRLVYRAGGVAPVRSELTMILK